MNDFSVTGLWPSNRNVIRVMDYLAVQQNEFRNSCTINLTTPQSVQVHNSVNLTKASNFTPRPEIERKPSTHSTLSHQHVHQNELIDNSKMPFVL